MRPFATLTAAALSVAALASAPSAAAPPSAEPASAYQPLAFLVGHCWRGTFPSSNVTDEHCFSWIYGGRFVRDEHVVRGVPGRADAFGESIYLWDAPSGRLEYLYIESAGGYSRGTVASEGAALVFPPSVYTEGTETRTIRSRWQRTAADAYDVVTEFQVNDRWQPGFSVHMQQVRD